jgi:hypothetical protein
MHRRSSLQWSVAALGALSLPRLARGQVTPGPADPTVDVLAESLVRDPVSLQLLDLLGTINFSDAMRTLIGVGTPRGLQGRLAALIALVMTLRTQVVECWRHQQTPSADQSAGFTPHHRFELLPVGTPEGAV